MNHECDNNAAVAKKTYLTRKIKKFKKTLKILRLF